MLAINYSLSDSIALGRMLRKSDRWLLGLIASVSIFALLGAAGFAQSPPGADNQIVTEGVPPVGQQPTGLVDAPIGDDEDNSQRETTNPALEPTGTTILTSPNDGDEATGSTKSTTPVVDEAVPDNTALEKYATRQELNEITSIIIRLQSQLENLSETSVAASNSEATIAALRADLNKLTAEKTAIDGEQATEGKIHFTQKLDEVSLDVFKLQLLLEKLQKSTVQHSAITNINDALEVMKQQIADVTTTDPDGLQFDARLNLIEQRLARVELAHRDETKSTLPGTTLDPQTEPSDDGNSGEVTILPQKKELPAERNPFNLVTHQDGTPALQRKGVVERQYLPELADAPRCQEIGDWLRESSINLQKRVVFVRQNNRVAKCKQLNSGEWKVFFSDNSDTGYVAKSSGG